MKEVKKETSSNNRPAKQPLVENLNLITYNKLKNGVNPAKIAEQFNISLSRISYHIASLIKRGLIKKSAYAFYEILKEYEPKKRSSNFPQKTTRLGIDNPQKDLNLFQPDSVRAHAFMFTLAIDPNLRNWDKREQFLKQKDIKYKQLSVFGGGQQLIFKKRKLWLTRKSIIVFEKASYMAETSQEARRYAIYDFLTFIGSFARYLKADFGRLERLKFKVSRQHYSLIRNSLAEYYDQENKKLFVYDSSGLWLVIDNSYNLHELETLHPKTGHLDNPIIQNFFNSLKENPFIAKDVVDLKANEKELFERFKAHSDLLVQSSMVEEQLTQKVIQIENFIRESKHG